MSDSETILPRKEQINDARGLVNLIFVVYALVLLSMGGFYFLSFGSTISSEHERWGQFGDFLGGILNPLTSFFTLLVAILVWSLQKKELAATRDELIETRKILNEQQRVYRLSYADSMLDRYLDTIDSHIQKIRHWTKTGEVERTRYGQEAIDEQLLLLKKNLGLFWEAKLDDLRSGMYSDRLKEPLHRNIYEKWQPLYSTVHSSILYINKSYDPAAAEERLNLLRTRLGSSVQFSLCYFLLLSSDSKFLRVAQESDLLRDFASEKIKSSFYKIKEAEVLPC